MSNTDLVPIGRTEFYGYVPTPWICYTFLVLFSLSTIVHFCEAFYFRPRLYWILPTVVMCGVGEIIGWAGRLWSSMNPINNTPYMTQLVTTIIAPTFLTAALYTILGALIKHLGVQYSRLSSKAYVKVFVTADVVALVVQAAGGGIASSANTDAGGKLGSNIMVAGIFLQLAGIMIYTFLATEYLLRFYLQKPLSTVKSQSPRPAVDIEDTPVGTPEPEKQWVRDNRGTWEGRGVMPPKIGMMIIALVLSTLFVFIRTIYRSIELLGGWNGHIIRTEVFFDVLDATPVFLAMFVFNVLPPGLLLRDPPSS